MSSNNGSPKTNLRIVGAVAGIGSGLTKVAVGHGQVKPSIWFDTIKTRLQCSPSGSYKGAFDVLTKIIQNEGFTALYKGATPPAVGWAAIDSVLLGSLHNYRLYLLRHGMTESSPSSSQPRLTILGHGFAGLFAGLTSAIIATPVELLKVKLQLQSQRQAHEREFRGPIDCTRQIIRTQGFFGMWSGFTGSLAFRSNFFWMFASFEVLMRGLSRLVGTPYEISTGSANFVSGGLASFVFWIMAIPSDNVKNRMMAYPYPLPYRSLAEPCEHRLTLTRPSIALVARRIYSIDGLPGFFRGLGPCLLRAFPVNACAFFVYEGSMRLMGAEKTRH